MIGIDTNLLVYAHRAQTPEHGKAKRAIARACADPRGCGIAAASVAELYAVVTHPAARGRPSRPDEVEALLTMLQVQGGVQLWQPNARFVPRLLQLARDLKVAGPRIFDLQIALTAIDNGATELWSHDANFVKVPGLDRVDPLA